MGNKVRRTRKVSRPRTHPHTHVLVTADTGTGDKYQKLVASMMESKIRSFTQACLLLGDNIYEVGTHGITDEQFHEKFETIYRNIAVLFYLLLGNHDWGNSYVPDGRHMSQVEYSKHSKKWNMPASYYHKSLGDCDFFFLDTNLESMNKEDTETQLQTMLRYVNQSTKRWKILCGHHTWRSVGGHGNAETPLEAFLRKLVAQGPKIHLYMCGHDHCKNVIKLKLPSQTLHCVVIGTGGKPYDPELLYLHNVKAKDSELLFHSPHLGFCELQSSHKHLHLTFYAPTSDTDPTCVQEYDLKIS